MEKGFEGEIEPNCPVLQVLRMVKGRSKAVSFKGLHGNRLSRVFAIRFEVNGLDVPLLDVPTDGLVRNSQEVGDLPRMEQGHGGLDIRTHDYITYALLSLLSIANMFINH